MNLFKLTTGFQLMAVHGMHWNGKKKIVLPTNSSSTFHSSGNDTEVHEPIAFKNFYQHQTKKK